ncbi:hypothetical protein EYF80_009354 [Liparis tanakae]|uniref:Uncharacterized protein n=1 Tax=Liparis tanakae TaxID=230148 RepID=A0A4Z2IQR2_9TELE|nr:hypothetical protein EYF80_009354 [Liparis tanakae]
MLLPPLLPAAPIHLHPPPPTSILQSDPGEHGTEAEEEEEEARRRRSSSVHIAVRTLQPDNPTARRPLGGPRVLQEQVERYIYRPRAAKRGMGRDLAVIVARMKSEMDHVCVGEQVAMTARDPAADETSRPGPNGKKHPGAPRFNGSAGLSLPMHMDQVTGAHVRALARSVPVNCGGV